MMNLTQRFVLGAVLLGIFAGSFLGLSKLRAARRITGHLPAAVAVHSMVVGRIDPAQLASGPVIALADDGSDVFLLQNRGWSRVGPRGAGGPYGKLTKKNPSAVWLPCRQPLPQNPPDPTVIRA